MSLHEQPVDTRIVRACAPGFPVVTRRALREVGIGRKSISRRCADGRLIEVLPDTFLTGVELGCAPPDLVAMAAVASVGPNSMLVGPSALERQGHWDRHDDVIHVGSATWRRACEAPRVVYHRRSALRAGPVVDGILTEDPFEALLTAGMTLSAHQLAFVIGRISYVHRLPRDEVLGRISVPRGHRAAPALRRAGVLVRHGSAGTKSRSEDALLPAISRELGAPMVNVRGSAGVPGYEPDFCHPDRRLIIEVDGDHHVDDPGTAEQDRARDALLRHAGWTVVRIPWRWVWAEPSQVIAELRAAFRATAR